MVRAKGIVKSRRCWLVLHVNNDTTKKTVILHIESAILMSKQVHQMIMSKWVHQITMSKVLGLSSIFFFFHYSLGYDGGGLFLETS